MSNDTQIKLDGAHGASVTQQVQYGIRFPNGTTAWNFIPGTSIDIKSVVELADPRHANHAYAWETEAAKRANAASVDVAEYGAAHSFIKRTVVLAVTDTEDVTK